MAKADKIVETKHITLKLTVKEFNSLEEVLGLVEDCEEESCDEYVAEGGKKSDHVYSHAQRVRKMINKQIVNVDKLIENKKKNKK